MAQVNALDVILLLRQHTTQLAPCITHTHTHTQCTVVVTYYKILMSRTHTLPMYCGCYMYIHMSCTHTHTHTHTFPMYSNNSYSPAPRQIIVLRTHCTLTNTHLYTCMLLNVCYCISTRHTHTPLWLPWTHVYLLPGKDVLVEVELQLLIGHVDTQLLKRVATKVLKTKDVQDPDVQHTVSAGGR